MIYNFGPTDEEIQRLHDYLNKLSNSKVEEVYKNLSGLFDEQGNYCPLEDIDNEDH